MAIWARGHPLAGLVHHSDRGVQYLSIRYTERLTEVEAVGSVGSRGRQLRERPGRERQRLYKAEPMARAGPWRTVEQVQLATAGWVDFWNHRRLHSACGDVPPAEHEAAYHQQPRATQVAA